MKEKKGFGGFWKKLSGSRELSLVAVLVLLCAVIQLRNNTFLTAKTIADLLKNYSHDHHHFARYDERPADRRH